MMGVTCFAQVQDEEAERRVMEVKAQEAEKKLQQGTECEVVTCAVRQLISHRLCALVHAYG